MDENRNTFLLGATCKCPLSLPHIPSLPLHNRYWILEHRSQENERVDKGPSTELPRVNQSSPYIMPVSIKRKRKVVVGNSLLRDTEGPVCWPDPSHREVCCFHGPCFRAVTRKFPALLWPSDLHTTDYAGWQRTGVRSKYKSNQKELQDIEVIGWRIRSIGGVFFSLFSGREEFWEEPENRFVPNYIRLTIKSWRLSD